MQSPKTATRDCRWCNRGIGGNRAKEPIPPFRRATTATIHLSCIMNGMQGKGRKEPRAGHGTKPPPKSLTKAKHIYSAVAKKDTGGV